MRIDSNRIDWNNKLISDSKTPYGTYAFSKYLPEIFPEVEMSRFSFNKIFNELNHNVDLISISKNFNTNGIELARLYQYVERGNTVFIAANTFNEEFLDTLGVDNQYNWLYNKISVVEDEFVYDVKNFFKTDTIQFEFTNTQVNEDQKFILRKKDHLFHFNVEPNARISVLTVDSQGKISAIRVQVGGGQFILSSDPYFFTNIYFLFGHNEKLVRYWMSYLESPEVIWTEFYERGRAEPQTPLRYILSQPSLKWALYLILITLFIYTLLEVRRKQRIIPILNPPVNNTLQFVQTVGNLYFEKKANHSIAMKRLNFFSERLNREYYIAIHVSDKHWVDIVSAKTGVEKALINGILAEIRNIQSKKILTVHELMRFSKLLDDFYSQSNFNKDGRK